MNGSKLPFQNHLFLLVPCSYNKDSFSVKFSRSEGPGGQSVNKTESRVTMYFDVNSQSWLPPYVREMLLKHKNSKNGLFFVHCQSDRSQIKNRQHCISKIYKEIEYIIEKIPKDTTIEKKEKISNMYCINYLKL